MTLATLYIELIDREQYAAGYRLSHARATLESLDAACISRGYLPRRVYVIDTDGTRYTLVRKEGQHWSEAQKLPGLVVSDKPCSPIEGV